MDEQKLDLLFSRLLLETAAILDAVQRHSVEEIGDALKRRQDVIDRISSLPEKRLTEMQRAKYNETVKLDKKASKAVRALLHESQDELKNSQNRLDGMLRYHNSGYDLSCGQMLDKKQ